MTQLLWIEIGGAAGAALLAAAGVWFFRRRSAAQGSSTAGVPTFDRPPPQAWIRRLKDLLRSGAAIDQNLYRELEEALITADVGVSTSEALLERLKQSVSRQNLSDPALLQAELKRSILDVVRGSGNGHTAGHSKPRVVLIVGVNGVGKTTTIGKLARRWMNEGQKVMLAAGDTFRAAAVEQLQIWGERAGVPVIAQMQGKDPAAVAFDAVEAACARNIDVLIIDTAGRLHTKQNLMEELKKVVRTIKKRLPEAPHETWLVLDATTGQNALQQAETFHASLGGLTGIVLTKLDGTAKGGILIALADRLKIPIRFIGIGEKAEDLRPFVAEEYVEALFAE